MCFQLSVGRISDHPWTLFKVSFTHGKLYVLRGNHQSWALVYQLDTMILPLFGAHLSPVLSSSPPPHTQLPSGPSEVQPLKASLATRPTYKCLQETTIPQGHQGAQPPSGRIMLEPCPPDDTGRVYPKWSQVLCPRVTLKVGSSLVTHKSGCPETPRFFLVCTPFQSCLYYSLIRLLRSLKTSPAKEHCHTKLTKTIMDLLTNDG